MQCVHCSQPGSRGFPSSRRLNRLNVAHPLGPLKVFVIERLFQTLAVINCFWHQFQMHEGAGDKDSVRVSQDFQRALLITNDRSCRGQKHATVEEGTDHPGLAKAAAAIRDFPFKITPAERLLTGGRDALADSAQAAA